MTDVKIRLTNIKKQTAVVMAGLAFLAGLDFMAVPAPAQDVLFDFDTAPVSTSLPIDSISFSVFGTTP